MAVSDQFGPMFVAGLLEDAVENTLKTWFATYLREAERQLGLQAKSMVDPQRYVKDNSFVAVKGEKLPRVVVISPGILGAPERRGKAYTAWWRVGVGVAHASSRDVASLHTHIYGAVARSIIIQKAKLDGSLPISDLVWLDETYDDLPIDHQTLQYRAAGVYFAFCLDNVVIRHPGPVAPDQAEYPDYGSIPDVGHVIVDINKEP